MIRRNKEQPLSKLLGLSMETKLQQGAGKMSWRGWKLLGKIQVTDF